MARVIFYRYIAPLEQRGLFTDKDFFTASEPPVAVGVTRTFPRENR